MNGSSVLNQSRSMYFNPSGPGDYTLPNLVGQNNVDSMKKNQPKFGFGKKQNNKSVVSKDHLVVRLFVLIVKDHYGRESPGIIYDPDLTKIKTKNPSCT